MVKYWLVVWNICCIFPFSWENHRTKWWNCSPASYGKDETGGYERDIYLVGGLEPWNFMSFHSVRNVIIPTDELHDFSEG